LDFAMRARTDDPRVIRLLLDHGADPNVRAREDDGLAPLHRASHSGRIERARLLVEHGASIETEDNYGRTPVDYARAYGSLEEPERDSEVLNCLLEHRTK
jgi:ankyrin repeat protein